MKKVLLTLCFASAIYYHNYGMNNRPQPYSQPTGIVCAICTCEILQNLAEEYTLLAPCLHRYHTNCIRAWLAQHNTCPLCRTEVSGEFKFLTGTTNLRGASNLLGMTVHDNSLIQNCSETLNSNSLHEINQEQPHCDATSSHGPLHVMQPTTEPWAAAIDLEQPHHDAVNSHEPPLEYDLEQPHRETINNNQNNAHIIPHPPLAYPQDFNSIPHENHHSRCGDCCLCTLITFCSPLTLWSAAFIFVILVMTGAITR